MLKCSENLLAYLQHFGVIDGAYCKTHHRFVLLAVTTLDADEEILILAWALVPQEDHANWLWFLRKIAPYLTSLQDPDAVIISDRLKGFASAVSICIPSATYSYSSKHFYDHLRLSYGEIVAQKFRRSAYAITESVFDRVFAEIKELNVEAAEYILKLPWEQWVLYAVKSARYGHITSNIQESQNAAWLSACNLPAVYIILSI